MLNDKVAEILRIIESDNPVSSTHNDAGTQFEEVTVNDSTKVV